MKKILVCFVGLALTACSANSLNYGAEQVRVMTSEPGKECSYLGDITGSQGNFFTGGWTSNSNLETGARNDLKNKAYKMGGNTVVLLPSVQARQEVHGTVRAQANKRMSR